MGAFYSRGHSLDVETTALAALAMMRSGSHPELVRKALTWVSRQKGVDGNWPSTQATILAMKAMLAGTGAALPSDVTSEVQVTVNGQPAGAIRVTPETSDLLHVLDLSGFVREGSNDVQIAQASTAELPYQLVGACWLPWTARSVEPPKELNIQVDYDRERLAVNDTMTCMVTVRNNGERAVGMAIVDLGIPPGFGVETDAFERMVGSGSLAKYDFTGNQCILYVAGIKRDVPLRFSYELRALYPVKAKAPASRIYEYYNPENEARTAARQFVVE
jgi:hypothetical protein